MSTRVTEGPVSRQDVDKQLFAIGQRLLRMKELEAQMNMELNQVKARYEPELVGQREEVEQLSTGLRLAVTDSRGDLFPDKRKSLGLLFGKIAFRDQPAAVKLAKGATTESVVAALERKLLNRYVHVTKDLARAALKQAVAAGEISAAILAECGIDFRSAEEVFYFEVDESSVRDEMEKGH